MIALADYVQVREPCAHGNENTGNDGVLVDAVAGGLAVGVHGSPQSDLIAAGGVKHVGLPHLVALRCFCQTSADPELGVLQNDLLVQLL